MHTVNAGGLGAAQERADVLGILERVEDEDQRRLTALGRPGEDVVDATRTSAARRRGRRPGGRRSRRARSATRPRPPRSGCAGCGVEDERSRAWRRCGTTSSRRARGGRRRPPRPGDGPPRAPRRDRAASGGGRAGAVGPGLATERRSGCAAAPGPAGTADGRAGRRPVPRSWADPHRPGTRGRRGNGGRRGRSARRTASPPTVGSRPHGSRHGRASARAARPAGPGRSGDVRRAARRSGGSRRCRHGRRGPGRGRVVPWADPARAAGPPAATVTERPASAWRASRDRARSPGPRAPSVRDRRPRPGRPPGDRRRVGPRRAELAAARADPAGRPPGPRVAGVAAARTAAIARPGRPVEAPAPLAAAPDRPRSLVAWADRSATVDLRCRGAIAGRHGCPRPRCRAPQVRRGVDRMPPSRGRLAPQRGPASRASSSGATATRSSGRTPSDAVEVAQGAQAPPARQRSTASEPSIRRFSSRTRSNTAARPAETFRSSSSAVAERRRALPSRTPGRSASSGRSSR